MEKNQSLKTQKLVMTGIFAAVLAVLSQFAIPMPSGMPVTLQTFAVALTGYVLGWKLGAAATAVYLLLGAVGVPVFANFSGGFGVLAGATGGFLWGFLFLAALCGAGIGRRKGSLIALSAAGLVICHILGMLQFMVVMKKGFWEAALLASVPYLLKDALSVAVAWILAGAVRKAMTAANMNVYA